MNMIKLLVFLLIMAILNVIREGVDFYVELMNPKGEYKLSWKRLMLLFISISYIATIIFTGFTL